MKKIINLFLAFCCLLCPAMLRATEFEEDGIVYKINDNYYDESGNTTLTVISINPDHLPDPPVEGNFNLRIPDSIKRSGYTNFVTHIRWDAFDNCEGMRTLKIPKSVIFMGNVSFAKCPILVAIEVDDENPVYDSRDRCNAIIETATNTLIAGCRNTRIPNTVTRIGSDALRNCTGLTSITIPNSVTLIGSDAFAWCTSLNSVEIGNSVTSIGARAFCNCTSLNSITIPNSVTKINYDAFKNTGWYNSQSDGLLYLGNWLICYKGTKPSGAFAITQGTRGIAELAFADCTGLTSIDLPNSLAVIGYGSFYGCSGLTNMTIPNSVLLIGDKAFYSCSSLTNLTIGNIVTTIGEDTFSGCSSLTKLTIPNSVTTIGNCAFSSCTGLTSMIIPESVNSIGVNPFKGCTNLTNIVVRSGNRVYDSRSNCNAVIETATNTLIAGCKNSTIPYSVSIIGSSSFYDCDGLKSISIPNSVVTIGKSAFSDCDGLYSVTIPNSVTSIGENAFFGCGVLRSVTIGNSVASIGDDAFWCCRSLRNLTIGNSVNSIGQAAFYNCSGLTDIYCNILVPSNVTMGTYVFEYVPKEVCTLHVPKGTKSLYKQAEQWKDFANIIDDIEVSVIPGDVNGDEKVNVSDVTALVNMILGVVPKDEDSADVNGDGKVNVSDVTALINIILGINYSNVTATANYSIDFGDDFFKAVDYVVIYYKDNAKIKFDAVSYGTSWRKTVTANQLPGEFGIKWKFYPKVVYDLNMETYNLLSTASISIITSNGGSISDSSEIISDVSTSKANVVETLENANGKSFGYKVSKNGVANRDDNLDYTL